MTDHVITPDDLEMSALTGCASVRVPGHPIASTQLEGVLRDARRVERDHRAGELDAEAALAELRDMAPVVDQARRDGPTQAGAVKKRSTSSSSIYPIRCFRKSNRLRN